MIDREPTPDEAERLDTHTSKLDVCGSPFYPASAHARFTAYTYTYTYTYTHKKSSRHAKLTEREEYVCSRMTDSSSPIFALFFYRRRHDRHPLLLFSSWSSLFARPPFSFSAIPLSSSLCMQPHFLLGWNPPNRFLFLCARQPFRVEWRLVGIVRLHSASRFVSNHSFRTR